MDSANVATIKACKGKPKARSSSQSKKAGLQFPVGRIKRYMKEGKYANRIGAGSAVYLSAVMEYLADLSIQVLELAGNQAKREKKSRITPSHIRFAVTVDEELRGLCGGAMFPSASAPPKIHSELLPKKSISDVFHRKPGLSMWLRKCSSNLLNQQCHLKLLMPKTSSKFTILTSPFE